MNDFARDLFAGLPEHYDVLAEALSFGQNRRWRRAIVEKVAGVRPGRVLDVATGTAGVALGLAARSPASVVGLDLSESMLARGSINITRAGMTQRVQLVLGRGEALPFASEVFDALTFTYLLRYVSDPQSTMCELARVVRPGGIIASHEFFVPPNPAARALWTFYTRLLLPIGGLAGGRAWYRVGGFLGASITRHYHRYPLAWQVRAWQAAGIVDVQTRIMSLGGGLVMWGNKANG
jgi:demethylmenaquinone methyltransferase/2-methoxy-6-polyprenyl-1,4-benzoquinol methylase